MKISMMYLITISLCLLSISSTLYSVTSNYTVIYERTYDELAYATYQQYNYERGWNYLRIYANQRKTLLDQHRGAGFIQGYITYRDIYSAYRNLCASQILQSENLSISIQNFMEEQLNYIDTMVETHPFDLYWRYTGAYLEQLRYMYRGYLTRINIQKTLYMYIGFSQFYYLTHSGDLEDLMMKARLQLKPQDNKGDYNDNVTHFGSAYLKQIDKTLYVAHSTIGYYQFLLRIFKTYWFPTRDTSVGSQWISFSSRPGDLVSKDDFYYLSSGLILTETSFVNYNLSKYKTLNPRTVPNWLRVSVAGNLARNGDEWVDYYMKCWSGTKNGQWMVVDPSHLGKNQSVVFFIQQAFTHYTIVDMTHRLNIDGYVGSYNIPVNDTIFTELEYQKSGHIYDNDSRAIDYRNYNRVIHNIEDMKKWLIKNNRSDTEKDYGLAPRYDLITTKNKKPFGLTDCKIIEIPQINKTVQVWVYSGPTISDGKFPAFNWSDWSDISHEGLAQKYNFTWQTYSILPGEKQQIISSDI